MDYHDDTQLIHDGPMMLSGQILDLNGTGGDGITLMDIAQGLCMANRYGGQTMVPYSVAQHSVLLAMHVPKPLKRYALMHDASEYILGDMIRPAKSLMPDYKATENRLSERIYNKYGVVPMSELTEYDIRITLDEVKVVQPGRKLKMEDEYAPLGVNRILMNPWYWRSARNAWLEAFGLLFPEHEEETKEAQKYFRYTYEPQPTRYVPMIKEMIC